MRKIVLPSALITASVLLATVASTTYAAITNPALGPEVGSTAALGTEPGALFVRQAVYFWNAIIVVGGLLVMGFFIIAAVEWITASGDSGKIQKARDKMIQGFIGLFVLVFSYLIINFVSFLLFGNQFFILNPTAFMGVG